MASYHNPATGEQYDIIPVLDGYEKNFKHLMHKRSDSDNKEMRMIEESVQEKVAKKLMLKICLN